jgi:hypothetical protein
MQPPIFRRLRSAFACAKWDSSRFLATSARLSLHTLLTVSCAARQLFWNSRRHIDNKSAISTNDGRARCQVNLNNPGNHHSVLLASSNGSTQVWLTFTVRCRTFLTFPARNDHAGVRRALYSSYRALVISATGRRCSCVDISSRKRRAEYVGPTSSRLSSMSR